MAVTELWKTPNPVALPVIPWVPAHLPLHQETTQGRTGREGHTDCRTVLPLSFPHKSQLDEAGDPCGRWWRPAEPADRACGPQKGICVGWAAAAGGSGDRLLHGVQGCSTSALMTSGA